MGIERFRMAGIRVYLKMVKQKGNRRSSIIRELQEMTESLVAEKTNEELVDVPDSEFTSLCLHIFHQSQHLSKAIEVLQQVTHTRNSQL